MVSLHNIAVLPLDILYTLQDLCVMNLVFPEFPDGCWWGVSHNPNKNKVWVSHNMGSGQGNAWGVGGFITNSVGQMTAPGISNKGITIDRLRPPGIGHLLQPALLWLKMSEEEPTTMLTKMVLYLWLLIPSHCPPCFPFFPFPPFLDNYSKLFTSSFKFQLLPLSSFSANLLTSHFIGKMRENSRKPHKSHYPSPWTAA